MEDMMQKMGGADKNVMYIIGAIVVVIILIMLFKPDFFKNLMGGNNGGNGAESMGGVKKWPTKFYLP